MPIDRQSLRNINFFNGLTGQPIGGVYQKGSLTEKTILWILGNILLVVDAPWSLHRKSSGRVVTSADAIAPGDYELCSSGQIRVSDEPWVPRLISYNVSGRGDSFCQGVRQRDQKCVLSGMYSQLVEHGIWAEFEAAHIFPLEHESTWIQHNYGQWVTDMENTVGASRINLVQNGLLVNRTIHCLFDQVLDPVCRDPGNIHRVSDEILRWYFRQSVLANMRGAGEPIFEHDFPPGTDVLATWQKEPYGKERFEMAVATKLKPDSENEPGNVS